MSTITPEQLQRLEESMSVYAISPETLIQLMPIIRKLNTGEFIATRPGSIAVPPRATFKLPDGEAPALENRIHVEDLDLKVRPYNCLKREGINHLDELMRCTPTQLLSIRNLGVSGIEEIMERLSAFGLSLREDPSWPPPQY